ncbi:MAG: UbiD family decarboxylase [Pirellulales bacterium]|nr:UbiD family decarboxylase [Pirellulales bacterium]
MATKAANPRVPPATECPYNVLMPYRSLTDILEELGHAGEISREEEEVDPALEVAEITAR